MADIDDASLLASAAVLLRKEERAEVASDSDVIREVAARFQALRRHPGFKSAHEAGEAFYEVPFTSARREQIVRGAIDCLIRLTGGGMQVLEFKTGGPRDEHAGQADVYRRAVASVFPGADIDVEILYPMRRKRSPWDPR